MARGDQADMERRLQSVEPLGWFPSDGPVASTLRVAFGWVAAQAFSLIAFAQAQTRLATASGPFVDLFGLDFLGLSVRRNAGQTDASYKATITREIFRERNTRRGVLAAVSDLTGSPARMIELWNPLDCGGMDTGYLGYDIVGRWGSVNDAPQFLLATLRPIGAGIPGVGGYDNGIGGYDAGSEEWGDQSLVTGQVTNQDIYDTINGTRSAGVTAWVAIGLRPEARLDVDFVLDVSEMT